MKKQLKPRTKSMNRIAIIVVVVGLFVSLGLYLRSIMVSPQVAEIGNTVSSSCQTNIATISFHDECDQIGTFKRSVYTCANGSTSEKLTNLNCISSEDILMEAQKYCGQTCLSPSITPSTSPMPSTSSTPTATAVASMRPSSSPTPYPSPSVVSTADPSAGPITCNLKTYKRPAGMDGWSESQVINPAGATINPGEQLAYAVEIINPNKYSVGGPLKLYTINLNGEKEPVNVKSYGGLCQLSIGGKTMSCFEERFQIAANSTKGLPSMTLVLEMLSPAITGIANTGIIFSGTLGSTEFKCEPTTYLTINTPTPTPGPGCTMEQRFCIQSLVGGNCPPVEVCPNPTSKPSPTPTPTPRACMKVMGSCATKTGTCLTYTDSCAKADYCATPFKACNPPVTTTPLPAGCRLEQIKCVQAPCEPVITCAPTSTPRPVVTPPTGRCLRVLGRNICLPSFRR